MTKRLLLAVLPLLVVCGLLEIVLRTTHLFGARLAWTEPDREIGWRFTPGREYWFQGENDHAITGRINSAGWRDHEHAREKPPRTWRVAVLGDSFVEAFQVELDSTFTSRLGRSLHAGAHIRGEVLNFGRSGMGPAEELIVLERDVIPRTPDVVVLVFTPHNDIADINPATATDAARPFFHLRGDSLLLDTSFNRGREARMREAVNSIKQHSALVSLAAKRYQEWKLARAWRHGVYGGTFSRADRMCTANPDSVDAANYALCKRLIARMASECSARGIRFVLTSVPLVYAGDAIDERRRTDATFDPGFFDRDLGVFSASEGLDFIPLTAGFEAEWARHRQPLHWQHWNYAGHRLVARLLGEALFQVRSGGERQRD
ncbi:MAG TPA: SGNH/GDSL hydrolase family protein [Gemmatimonadaceae bacterium]